MSRSYLKSARHASDEASSSASYLLVLGGKTSRLYFKVMGVAFIIAMALGGLVLLAMLSCGLAL